MVYDYFPILKERSSQLAGNISGGQQQMVVIAQGPDGQAQAYAFWMNLPSVFLLCWSKKSMEFIKRINREQGTTILLIEQNAPMALSLVRPTGVY